LALLANTKSNEKSGKNKKHKNGITPHGIERAYVPMEESE
jgi:hypothetical protein